MSRPLALLTFPALILSFACVSVRSGFAIGPENNGATKDVTVGSELRLVLPADIDWNIESTNTSALALKNTRVGTVGGSPIRIWNFDVKQAGEFVLRATGDVPCRRDTPPCASPTVRYEFRIRAR